MKAIEDLKLYAVGDLHWFIARNAQDALEQYIGLTEEQDAELIDRVECVDEADLDRLDYYDDLDLRSGQRTFREQVERLKDNGKWERGIFAVGEY